MRVYTITNEKYCQEPVDATFDQLKEFCDDMGWQHTFEQRWRGGKFIVVDEIREVVAEEKFPEKNGIWVQWAEINQAYFVMWHNKVLRVLNTIEEVEQEYIYLTTDVEIRK